MKKYPLAFGLAMIMLLAACSQEPAKNGPEQITVIEPSDDEEEDVQTETPSAVKEFDMIASQWEFEPSTIKVNEGDKVVLNIKSEDVAHGFAIFEFDVNKRLEPGTTTKVEFVADKRGEYTFFCSVSCGKGHRDMKGTLIVE